MLFRSKKKEVRSGGWDGVRIKKMILLVKKKIGRKKSKVENIVIICDKRGTW